MKKRITGITALLIVAVLCLTFLCGCSSDTGTPEEIPTDSEPVIEKKTTLSILLLGCDYLISAEVATIARMLFLENGVTLSIDSVCPSLATFSDLYSTYKAGGLSKINENKYDVIVISAINHEKDAKAIMSFYDDLTAESVKSDVVLLPSEHEPIPGMADYAKKQIKGLYMADWGRLIKELKNSERGFSSMQLNIIDWLLRPNVLSGYAAAVLLYTRLYGELPVCDEINAFLLGLDGEDFMSYEYRYNAETDAYEPYVPAEDENYTPYYQAYTVLIPGTSVEEKIASLSLIAEYAQARLAIDDKAYADYYATLAQ